MTKADLTSGFFGAKIPGKLTERDDFTEALVKQLMVLYIFIVVGMILGKWRRDMAQKSGVLSFLLVNLLLPSKLLLNYTKNFTVAYLQNNYVVIFISLGFLGLLILSGKLIGKILTREEYAQKVYHYSVTVSNYAFLGYVLMENAFGSEALNNMMVFCLPFGLYCYTFGVALLMDKKVSFKALCNPTNISIALGMVFGLTGIKLPSVISSVASSASAAVGPISMLLVGLVLSEFTWKELRPTRQTWVFSVFRLLVLPAGVFGVCMLLRQFMELPAAVYPSAVFMAAMPCGLNPVIYPRLIGKDCSLGAKLIPLTAILSCATIPLWLYLTQI